VLGNILYFPTLVRCENKKKLEERLLDNHKRTQNLRGSPLRVMSTNQVAVDFTMIEKIV
jgi:hypothetical protein